MCIRDSHKTVYVVASYPVAAVELLVNGRRVGRCDKPQNTFVFAFPGVDVTQSGWVEAVGYGYDGTPAASDRLETADSPADLRLTLHTAQMCIRDRLGTGPAVRQGAVFGVEQASVMVDGCCAVHNFHAAVPINVSSRNTVVALPGQNAVHRVGADLSLIHI